MRCHPQKKKLVTSCFRAFPQTILNLKQTNCRLRSCDAVSIGLVRINTVAPSPTGLGPGDATCTDASRHGHRPRACPAASRHRGNHGPDVGHQHSVHVSTEPGHHRPSKTSCSGLTYVLLHWPFWMNHCKHSEFFMNYFYSLK